jgi:hypothetical protein
VQERFASMVTAGSAFAASVRAVADHYTKEVASQNAMSPMHEVRAFCYRMPWPFNSRVQVLMHVGQNHQQLRL